MCYGWILQWCRFHVRASRWLRISDTCYSYVRRDAAERMCGRQAVVCQLNYWSSKLSFAIEDDPRLGGTVWVFTVETVHKLILFQLCETKRNFRTVWLQGSPLICSWPTAKHDDVLSVTEVKWQLNKICRRSIKRLHESRVEQIIKFDFFLSQARGNA